MKKIYVILLVTLMVIPVFANDTKLRVAVFDPASSGTPIDEGTKAAIREIISSTIVNAGNYDIVERSLLEKVMQEQSFSNSGAVDDNDAMEIGKLAGANKVVLSVVTLTGGRNMLSIKIIDVKTANVEKQRVKIIKTGEMLDAVEPMTLELIDVNSDSGFNISNKKQFVTTVMPTIALESVQKVRGAKAIIGEGVDFRITKDVIIDGQIILPAGTIVTGSIYEAKRSTCFGTPGKLGVKIDARLLTLDGRTVNISHLIYIKGQNRLAASIVVFCCTLVPIPCGGKAVMPEGYRINASIEWVN